MDVREAVRGRPLRVRSRKSSLQSSHGVLFRNKLLESLEVYPFKNDRLWLLRSFTLVKPFLQNPLKLERADYKCSCVSKEEAFRTNAVF